jgi:hypothetical protein
MRLVHLRLDSYYVLDFKFPPPELFDEGGFAHPATTEDGELEFRDR